MQYAHERERHMERIDMLSREIESLRAHMVSISEPMNR